MTSILPTMLWLNSLSSLRFSITDGIALRRGIQAVTFESVSSKMCVLFERVAY